LGLSLRLNYDKQPMNRHPFDAHLLRRVNFSRQAMPQSSDCRCRLVPDRGPDFTSRVHLGL